MAAEQQTRNRTRLLCPFCKKTVYSLPAHLRNTCVKESSEIRIKQLVDSAKKEAQRFLQHGRIWEFSELYHIMEQPDRLNGMIKELQNRGNVVRNLPPKDLPTASAAESCQSPESIALLLRIQPRKSYGFIRQPIASDSFTLNDCQAWTVGGSALNMIGPEESERYLGIRVNPMRGVMTPELQNQFEDWVRLIGRAPPRCVSTRNSTSSEVIPSRG
ncbi:hypothetical protein MHYP_G00329250 [Metynnis hypsauchen]